MTDIIYDYFTMCQEIKELNSSILFAGIINQRGHLVARELKPQTAFFISAKDDEMLFMELALRVRMRREFDHLLGPVLYSITVRKNHIGFSFPIQQDFLYVATKSDMNMLETPQQIIQIINKHGKV